MRGVGKRGNKEKLSGTSAQKHPLCAQVHVKRTVRLRNHGTLSLTLSLSHYSLSLSLSLANFFEDCPEAVVEEDKY